MNKLIVAIMAGGLGKRMESNIPKVLHKLDKLPLIVHVINTALQLNPEKILIIVGKYKIEIEEEIKKYINKNIIEKNIEYIIQNEPLGTGHAVRCCIDYFKDNIDSNILILSGDVPLISKDTLFKFITSDNNISLLINEINNPYGYGRIILKNNIFDKIVEEKDANNEEKLINIVNSGIYYIKSDLLVKYLPLINNNNNQNEYYLTDILEIIKNRENININLFLLEKNKNYEILGVNTKDQLIFLENTHRLCIH